MKCYFCHGDGQHGQGCPKWDAGQVDLAVPVKKQERTFSEEEPVAFDRATTRYNRKPVFHSVEAFRSRETIKTISFLSLIPSSGSPNDIMIPGCEIKTLQSCGDNYTPSRLKRLWVDKTIADYFTIQAIFIGIRSPFVAPTDAGLPANMFATGTWPRKPRDVDSEYGIDLRSWPIVHPGTRVSVQFRNLSLAQMPCRACFEIEAV